MKNFFNLFGMGLVVLVLSSCDQNVGKVEEVAKQFVEGVIAKDTVAIYEMYPNTRVYSSLLLPDSIIVDGMKVEFNKSDSLYVVKLNEKQSLICGVDSSRVKIYDSYNVLKLDSLSDDLVAKMGFLQERPSDIDKGEAFSVLEAHLALYSEAFKDVIFYENSYLCMMLSTPDKIGKGQGVIGELGGFLPTFYDFHYAIDLEHLNEAEISCKMDKYNTHFTVEIDEKNLYYRSKGNLEILRGEKDPETYNSFLERIKKINDGDEVYGNPKYGMTISEY